MSHEFKDYTTLAGEDVEIINTLGQGIEGEIVAETEGGYYIRVSKEGGQEYFLPKATVLMIEARSRKIGGASG